MLKPHRILALALLAAGCERTPTDVASESQAPSTVETCGARAGTAATPQETISLAHTKTKESSTCSRADARCDFYISTDSSEISVRVNFIFIDPYSGCMQAGDGYVDYIYDKQGKFLRTEDIGS